MPELPEVEILRRHLEPQLMGRQVRETRVFRPRIVRPGTAGSLAAWLEGARFEGIRRRGKHLLFDLRRADGSPGTLAGHLGMTGRMWVDDARVPVPRHTVVALDLDRGRFLFVDARQFGRLTLDLPELSRMGPEPLEESWTVSALTAGLRGSRQPIKVRLMDQHVVAGLGNIYAAEALFEAGISPLRSSDSLTPEEIKRLHRAVRMVLGQAVTEGLKASLDFAGGSDGLFYFGSSAGAGGSSERMRVYDREGQPCRRCGVAIRQVGLGGRSTYFCPACQPIAAGQVARELPRIGRPHETIQPVDPVGSRRPDRRRDPLPASPGGIRNPRRPKSRRR